MLDAVTATRVPIAVDAVAASLLLQHGCPLDTLRQALTRDGDGSGSGPLAHALDLLTESNDHSSAVQCAAPCRARPLSRGGGGRFEAAATISQSRA